MFIKKKPNHTLLFKDKLKKRHKIKFHGVFKVGHRTTENCFKHKTQNDKSIFWASFITPEIIYPTHRFAVKLV